MDDVADITEIATELARAASVGDAQDAIRVVHGRTSSRALAEHAGISGRTARRWLSPAYPRQRASRIKTVALEMAGMGGLAAQRLRHATDIDLGHGTQGRNVNVAYKATGRNEGDRFIPKFSLSRSNVANYIGQTAQCLARGDMEMAAELFSDACICGYEDGLEETLYIVEYYGPVRVEG